MSNKLILAITLLLTLVIAACSGGDKVSNEQFAFLDKIGITVTDQLLLGDTLALPDVYCGDPEQEISDLKGKRLNSEQHEALIVPIGLSLIHI